MRHSRSIIVMLWLALAGAAAAAQSDTAIARPSPGVRPRLLGVFDAASGEPLPGVEVRDAFSGASAVTSATGTVLLSFVVFRGRAAIVELRKVGYTPGQVLLDVRDTSAMTEILERVNELPAVVTKAKADDYVRYTSTRLQGFEDRRHTGLGQFISEAELRKHDSQQVSDIIQRYVRNVSLVSPMRGPNPNAQYLISQRGHANLRGSGPCYVSVYEDGVLIYSSTIASKDRGPPDLRAMGIATYAGVEFYPGGATVPPEYNITDSGCGVLLLWTRER